MNADQFRETRQEDWQTLTNLVNKANRSIQSLTPEQITQLSNLYRAATSDLALARRDYPRHRITAYLNQLVGRAHAVVYRSEPLALKRLLRFATHGFPQAYRRAWKFNLASALLFLLPAIIASLATFYRPETANQVLPAGFQGMIDMIERGELWVDIPVSERPFQSTFIMSNNIQVAFMAFGGGLLAGLMTLWVLVQNGIILGGITGLTSHYGIGFELWTFVIGHGVVELSVIAMSGAAGLQIGWSMLKPGLLRRRDAIQQAAGQSVRLLLGCVPLLVFAGTIEGFVSPNETIPWFVKWAVGLGSGALLYTYLLFGGRELPPRYRRLRLFNSR